LPALYLRHTLARHARHTAQKKGRIKQNQNKTQHTQKEKRKIKEKVEEKESYYTIL
jgi:hypothetical protein